MAAVLSSVLAGCGDPSWRDIASPDGGFRVKMHGDPRVEQRNVDTPAGRITGHLYSLEEKDSIFAVGFADYPYQLLQGANPRRMFAAVREGWLKRIEGRPDGEPADIKLDGKWYGMEFSARGKLEGREAWMRGRLYLVDNRLYQLVVFGNKESIPISDINRFMGSFKVEKPRETAVIQINPGTDKEKK